MSCKSCGHPNDFDCHFCQKCGVQQSKDSFVPPPTVDINCQLLDDRRSSLQRFKEAKPYQRQKGSLQKQLESFLWSLPSKRTLALASPEDVVNFLIWRDKFGKTESHLDSCLASRTMNMPCACHKGLAAGTIKNNIGKLSTIFKENGRGSTWNDDLHLGNPASHPSVKEYYGLVLEEQAMARSFPSQAVPLFMDKLVVLCNSLKNQIKSPGTKPSAIYILARDLAFFSVDFFSGDRGSDLGRVKSVDILSTPDGDSFIFNQVFGKTLRGNGSNVFAVKKIENSPVCPVSNLKLYLSLSRLMSIDLKTGFLFRATNRQGHVTENPFFGSAVANRLKKHLQKLSISSGETMHSFRSGCSITLALLGISYPKIAEHVGWRSVDMAMHYTQCDKVIAPDNASSLLASSAAATSAPSVTTAERLGQLFRARNSLEGYKPLFE